MIGAEKELQCLFNLTTRKESSMTTEEIKAKIRKSRIYQYEIAAQLHLSEFTLCKWFHRELTQEQQDRILAAIEKLKAGEADA